MSDGETYNGPKLDGKRHNINAGPKAFLSKPGGESYYGCFDMGLKHGSGTHVYYNPDTNSFDEYLG